MPFKKTKIILSLIMLYSLFGFVLLPYLLHSQLPRLVHDATQGKLVIENIDFNPFFMELDVDGVRFDNPDDEPLFSLQKGAVNLDLSALVLGKLHFYAITLEKPELFIVRQGERFNFSWLTERNTSAASDEPAAPPSTEETTLPPVKLIRFTINDGSVTYRDMNHETPFEVALSPFSFQARQIDLKKSDADAQVLRFHTEISDGGSIDIQSRLISASPLALEGSIDIEGLKPYTGWRYTQERLNLEVADGLLMLHADYRFNSQQLDATRIENLRFALERLRIKPKETNHDILRIKRLALNNGYAEPLRSRIALDTLSLDSLELFAKRNSTGDIDLQSYLAVTAKDETATAKEPTTQEVTPAKPWLLTLKRFDINGTKLRFEDNSLQSPAVANIDRITLQANNISSEVNTTLDYTLSMRINTTGTLRAEGNVTHTPLRHTERFELSGLQLKDTNPYLAEAATLNVESGTLHIKGSSTSTASEKEGKLQLKASATVTEFELKDSRDASALVTLEKLSVKPIRFDLAPNRLNIGEVRLQGFHAEPRIDKEGELNFASLQKTAETAPAQTTQQSAQTTAATKESDFPVTIGKFTVAQSSVDFTDLSAALPYKARLHDIKGYISDIAIPQKGISKVDIATTIDKYATAHIKGRLITADPARDTDLSIDLRNLAMQSFTPYSGKFVGRAIDEGKLALDLKYRIVESKMQGENALVINKIELGRDIESEDAMSLPLGLAIALLEDKDGIIDIDMPVKGDLNNPEFRYGKVIIKAIGDLIVKVASAPFRFLGSLLGIDGDELEYIAFEAGSSALLPPEREKLDKLAGALQMRPKLLLDIAGSYHGEADARIMRQQRLYYEAIALSGDAAFSKEGNITLETMEQLYVSAHDETSLKSLKAAFKEQTKDSKTFKRRYPMHLMQTLLAGYSITEEELIALARQRAVNIRDHLIADQKVEAGHITLAAEQPVKEEKSEQISTQLALKF